MDLDFTDEHEMLREMVRAVCTEHSPLEVVRALEDDAKGYPDALWKQLVELGLVGILIPEKYGGQGQSLLEAAIAYEEFGRALAPTPHFQSSILSALAIMHAGSDAQKQAWLPRIAEGDAILTPAWLEPRNGFGAKGVQLRAVADAEDAETFVLSGTKMHVNFASSATRLLVLARTGDAEEAISLFLIDPRVRGGFSIAETQSRFGDDLPRRLRERASGGRGSNRAGRLGLEDLAWGHARRDRSGGGPGDRRGEGGARNYDRLREDA